MHSRKLSVVMTLALLGLGCDAEPDDGDTQNPTTQGDEASTGDEAPTCEEATSALSGFISANNACSDDSDCVGADALCYPQNSCALVGLNGDYDQATWSELYDQLVESCGDSECGADPCGGMAVCVNSRCVITL